MEGRSGGWETDTTPSCHDSSHTAHRDRSAGGRAGIGFVSTLGQRVSA